MSQYTTKNGDNVNSATVLIDQIKSLEPISVTQQRAEKQGLNVNTNFVVRLSLVYWYLIVSKSVGMRFNSKII